MKDTMYMSIYVYVYMHLMCICILMVVYRWGGKSVKRKHFEFSNTASKTPNPHSSRQFLSGGWGQRPPPRPSITRCEL